LNYTINNGATVSVGEMSASADGLTTVVLTTSPLTVGSAYVLTINNVRDLAANPIAPNPTQLTIAIPVTSDKVHTSYSLEGTDLLILEAEDYNAILTATDGHAWTLTTTPPFIDSASTNTTFSGSGSMIVLPDANENNFSPNPGDMPTGIAELDYKVFFPAAGDYAVWVRGSGNSDTDGNSDSVNVGLDGVVAYRINALWPAPEGYTWGTTPTPPDAVFTVPAPGLHTFNLWMREDGFAVDKVILTANSTYTPTGLGPVASPGSRITIASSATKVVLNWAGGFLQSSTNVAGPYNDIIGSSSPWTNAPTGVQKYYRVRQ
jgi:hypothetical protein